MTRYYNKMKRCISIPLGNFLIHSHYEGLENVPESGGFILCCNHTSATDVALLINAVNRQIFFMAKQEAFKIPVLGRIIRKMGAFAVNRGVSDRSAINRAFDVINEGNILGIFPEGTRNKDCSVPKSGKPGVALIAMKTKADILPVSIYREGKFRFFCRTTVRIGKLIKFDELPKNESERREMMGITAFIMKKITQLWEMKH